ncbi:MAG TPA: peptidylprolyl isomerase [Candidatus Binatia bacterium]|jgi:cyclophilin family peptidyl-prolyl cis-trans isomerase|nr:peptidylprolyl isomerase [Candidatus Binatia bacterium]
MSRWRFAAWISLSLCCVSSVRAGTLAQFRTVFGNVDVELYDQDKPVTVQNFIRYVQSGKFQDEFAHRLMPGFVVQGGGFTVTNRGTTNWQIAPIVTYAPITNEFGTGRRFSNVYGTIAMAKLGGDTNSASSEWFFNLADNSYLDAPDTNNFFVVFGTVLRGTNVLNILNNFQYYTGIQASNLVLHQYYAPPFDDLPLLYPSLADTNLLFVDISLLSVQITATNHQRQISWNSVNGKTNLVEYTTNLPPAWKTLASTNGNGNRYTITDPAATNTFRFYRVRVIY